MTAVICLLSFLFIIAVYPVTYPIVYAKTALDIVNQYSLIYPIGSYPQPHADVRLLELSFQTVDGENTSTAVIYRYNSDTEEEEINQCLAMDEHFRCISPMVSIDPTRAEGTNYIQVVPYPPWHCQQQQDNNTMVGRLHLVLQDWYLPPQQNIYQDDIFYSFLSTKSEFCSGVFYASSIPHNAIKTSVTILNLALGVSILVFLFCIIVCICRKGKPQQTIITDTIPPRMYMEYPRLFDDDEKEKSINR